MGLAVLIETWAITPALPTTWLRGVMLAAAIALAARFESVERVKLASVVPVLDFRVVVMPVTGVVE